MRDRRPVDELSIEELERILAIRRRKERQERLRRMGERGRRMPSAAPLDAAGTLDDVPPAESQPSQHEAAADYPPPEPPVTYDITDDIPRFEDEIAVETPVRRPTPRPASRRNGGHTTSEPRPRSTWDRLLLLIEVVGVIGIIVVLVYGGYLIINENNKIEALEQKSADIQREADAMRATPTPRPDLSVRLTDYVLPGGHYSPDQTGGEYALNLDEIPESLRPMAVAQLTAPQVERVAPQANSPVEIVIDTSRVQVQANIYGGDDWYSLLKGVGHLAGSADPGEPRNMVLSAHNDIYGEIFRDIEHLEKGDEIRVRANNGQWYTYVVDDKFPVDPTDVWVLAPGNEPVVTLITCWPYRVNTKRMIVIGKLVSGPQT